MGLMPSINMGRKKVGEYLICINDAVQNCISSLNKAMAN